MTQEEKQLLLIDLCARLPYGVKCRMCKLDSQVCTLLPKDVQSGIEQFEPYLRPLSSMTEEEWKEFEEIFGFPIGAGYNTVTKKLDIYNYVVIDKGYGIDIWLDDIANMLNWLNARHFDYRGLIEKGLAIAVTEENNPYKED